MKITEIMAVKTNLEDWSYLHPYASMDVTFLPIKVGLITNK